ncbi:MAG: hypothetical protein FWC79_03080 [Oscillospiraceae bacterium]|nr:hypothetical protein [Oscillospiraceae bacterium]
MIERTMTVRTTVYCICFACCERRPSDPNFGLSASGIRLQPGMRVIATGHDRI